jgi:hypothetical protein
VTIARVARGFGRPSLAPAMLGGPVDDLVQQIKDSDAWYAIWNDAANKATDQIERRFAQDQQSITNDLSATLKPKLEQIARESIETLKPQVQQDIYDLFDDAATQARIGQTQDQIKAGFIQVVAVGAVATALTTWLLVRYAGGK